MKTSLLRFIPIITLAFVTVLSSCKKKCDLPDDVNSGEIKSNILIYPEGSLTQGEQSTYLITGNSPNAETIKMSTDEGMTKTAVDWGSYSVLCYPTTTSCNTSFARDVEIDDVNGIVYYTITMKECGKCDSKVATENIVVIRSIPETYEVFFDVKTE